MYMQKYSVFMVVVLSLTLSYAQFSFCDADPKKSHLNLHTSGKKKESFFTPAQWSTAKVVGGMIATAGIGMASDKFIGDGKGNDRMWYNGKYAWGFAQSLKLSSVCLTIAPLLHKESGDILFRWGARTPIVAAIAAFVANDKTQKLAAYAPFGIGQHLSTFELKNGKWESKCGDHCNGICDRCILPKTVLAVGLYKAIDPLVDKVSTYIAEKLGFVNEEDESF